jgi:lysophospholipase L1-like esterase
VKKKSFLSPPPPTELKESVEEEVVEIKFEELKEELENERIVDNKSELNFVGSFNYVPDPIEYNEGAIYKNVNEGVAYIRKGLLWEELVRDGKPGRDAARVGAGGGLGLTDVQSEIKSAFPVQHPLQLQTARVVVIGDSQTQVNNIYFNNPYQVQLASPWPTHLAAASQGHLTILRNVGIGGQRTDNMLARFSNDVLGLDPDLVIIAASINDGNLANKEKDGIANTIAMIKLAQAYRSKRVPNGCRVVLCTTPPTGSFDGSAPGQAGDPLLISNYNNWKRDYCASNNIPLIDFYSLLVDQSGTYKTGATIDGVHPLTSWQKTMGTYAWQQLSPFFVSTPTLLPYANNDPNNLFPNAMLISGTNKPTSWVSYGGGAMSESLTIVSGYRGTTFTAINSGASSQYYEKSVSLTGRAGHLLRLSVMGESTSGALGGFKWSGGSLDNQRAFTIESTQPIDPKSEFISEVRVPSDATGIFTQFAVQNGSTVKLAAIGIYDLTALGLAT